ncbi:MAG: type II toxin-antitoxin system RelE/ParE family toxin [Geminicoccaceae bacterium]
MSAALLSPQARRDLADAAGWIARNNPQAARALRDTVARAAGLIGRFPKIGSERPDLADPPVRFHVLRGFPYVLVYDADGTPPRILRVLDGARDLPELLRDFPP